MAIHTRRGFVPDDARDFSEKNQLVLREALKDIAYLVNRGYSLERAVTFISNSFSFTARQRLALQRSCASDREIACRKDKEIRDVTGETVYIDAFNIIISLEIALSGSLLLLCMDGTIRDLAGLHGTYRMIDKTLPALNLIFGKLADLKAARAVFYIDAPISNSGNLSKCIKDLSGNFPVITECHVINSPDKALYDKTRAVTSDSIILNHCESWINLARTIIEETFPGYPLVVLN